MKKFYKLVLLILCLTGFISGCFISSFGGKHFDKCGEYPDIISIYEEPEALAGKAKIMVDEVGNIYATSDGNCHIQKYDKEGSFLFGISVPSSGGSYYSFLMKDVLYVYVVRTRMYYEVQGKEVKELGEKEPVGDFDGFKYETTRGTKHYVSKKSHIIEVMNRGSKSEKSIVQLKNTPLCYNPTEAEAFITAGILLRILSILGIGFLIKDAINN